MTTEVARPSLGDEDEYLNVLWYGPQGTWKTSHLLSLANRGRFILINCEGGAKKSALRRLGINVDNVEPHSPNSYSEAEDLYWEIKSRLDDGEPIVGVGVDSYTDFQRVLVWENSEKRVDKAKRAGKTGDFIDPLVTDRDDYGKWTKQANLLTRKFRDLPVHFGATALERREVDSTTGKLALLPQITQAFRVDLMGYVDMVIKTVTAENPFAITPLNDEIEGLGITRQIGKHHGKDRFGITPPVMAYPSFERLVALLEGDLDIEVDPYQRAYIKRMNDGEDVEGDKVSAEADTEPVTADGSE